MQKFQDFVWTPWIESMWVTLKYWLFLDFAIDRNIPVADFKAKYPKASRFKLAVHTKPSRCLRSSLLPLLLRDHHLDCDAFCISVPTSRTVASSTNSNTDVTAATAAAADVAYYLIDSCHCSECVQDVKQTGITSSNLLYRIHRILPSITDLFYIETSTCTTL